MGCQPSRPSPATEQTNVTQLPTDTKPASKAVVSSTDVKPLTSSLTEEHKVNLVSPEKTLSADKSRYTKEEKQFENTSMMSVNKEQGVNLVSLGEALPADESGNAQEEWRAVNIATLKHSHPDLPWWDMADYLLPIYKVVVQPNRKRHGWKTVRLFVSSTFKDMHSEREYLVKRIFPQLRDWCEKRRLRLVECDLRWGVPKHASTRQTLDACLSEIDRCYEENEYPYLLALISERYGWVPSESEMPPDIKHKYKWIPGMSVTTMELMTGGYWSRNPNALYMLREPNFLEPLKQEAGLLSAYTERREEDRESLRVLKERLKNQGTDAGKVYSYSCEVDKLLEKRAELTGLERFGETVMQHFQMAMERQYPVEAMVTTMSTAETQALQHEAFMLQRSTLLLGRDEVMGQVVQYVNEDTTSPLPLVILGFPGSGKSAVMATAATRALSQSNNKVVYHFIGATPGSTDVKSMLTRIWTELMPAEDKPPVDSNELRHSLQVVLDTSSRQLNTSGMRRLVLIIDALNQLDDDATGTILDWLPRQLPENVRVLVSTLEGPCLDALRRNQTPRLPEVLVSPLGQDVRRAIVSQILSEFNKELDEEQLSCLVNKEDAGRPLYLSIAAEELRVFGEFRKLTQKIEDMPQHMTTLLGEVLDRIIAENGGELVLATLSLIECSRFGLLENELLDMLAPFSNIDNSVSRLPMAEWAIAYLGLRRFLRPAGGSGEGRLDFYHRTISKAIRNKYLQDSSKKIWHQRIADYFKTSMDLDRRAEELPYQLIQIEDVAGLKMALVEQTMFERLCTPAYKQNLMSYWLYAGGYQEASTLSLKAMQAHLEENRSTLSAEDVLAVKTKMLNFLIDIGEYAKAEIILEEVLTSVKENFGKDTIQMCEPLFLAVLLFYLQGIRVVYSSDPVYQRCSRIGREYSPECARLHKTHYKSDPLHLGRVLAKCCYFQRSLLGEAEAICKNSSPQDYAEVLYNKGEKHQYEKLSIPVGYFKESLKLCLQHFGPYHMSTARCYQLYGQVYWNQYTGSDPQMMVTCLSLYQKELDIMQKLLGGHHPLTVRSREDVIIILQTLERNAEANELQKFQPS